MYYRARYYHPALGRFLTRDPIGNVDGPNSYQYASSSPLSFTDPTGELSWKIDSTSCTIELTAKVQLDFKDRHTGIGDYVDVWYSPWPVVQWNYDRWTEARKTAFRKAFKSGIETTFNGSAFKIFPAVNGVWVDNMAASYAQGRFDGKAYCTCPCTDGFTPSLKIEFGWFNDDFTIEVKANRSGRFMRSSANVGGPNAWLDEADVNPRGTRGQIPAVHEFGHLLGLRHPGQLTTPRAVPGSTEDYAADANSLMGSGMTLRTHHFQKWAGKLDSEYPHCKKFTIR